VDGLAAEREQGITIDVAYRFFSTERRKFIVADTPGHEQYTRNMVTGASTADAAVLMVDARKGVLVQTRRHSYLVSLLGIRHVVVAINKMDLVDYSEKVFQRIVDDYRAFAKQIGLENVTFIPVSAFKGDNITGPSEKMPWYHGTTLMGYLETVEVDDERMQRAPFRMPVQWVNRPTSTSAASPARSPAAASARRPRSACSPPARRARSRIVTLRRRPAEAVAGQSVTLTLADEIDISRGDLISRADARRRGRPVRATIVWMHDEPLLPGRAYLLKIGAQTVTASSRDQVPGQRQHDGALAAKTLG
jgi:bifunctional enzyme CysN/CysC